MPNTDVEEWVAGPLQSTFTVILTGAYWVDVTNNNGDTKISTHVAYEICAYKFYLPSAFTPNRDGYKDIFLLKYECQFSNYQLNIFNRWASWYLVRPAYPMVGTSISITNNSLWAFMF